jgi:predicted metal-dependent peptidase
VAVNIEKLRLRLILDHPFYGSMIMGLKVAADSTCDTAWTDGKSIGYNPEWLGALPPAQQLGLLAHEVMHVALLHNWRRGSRDPKRWNVAADYAINPIVLKAGFELPPGGLLDPKYAGKSAEEIYAILPPDAAKPQSGKPQSGKGATGAGDIRDGSSEPEARENAEIAAQAAAARAVKAGDTSEAVTRIAKPASNPGSDWRAILRDVVRSAVSREDYSWTRPNPRYIGRGLYLPQLRSESLGCIAVAIDTSGSIDLPALAMFLSEVNALRDETKPETVHYVECDTRVQRTATLCAADDMPPAPVGGGGTRFAPVFEHLESLNETPAVLVYFTDLESGDLRTLPDPGFPVVWVSPHETTLPVPFGSVACIPAR